MSSIREKALKLLAGYYDRAGKIRDGRDIRADDLDTEEGLAVAAIVESMTPPAGYVLVPAEPTDAMVAAARDAHMPFGDMESAIAAAIAARPEVLGG
jgi:hypothetical protein